MMDIDSYLQRIKIKEKVSPTVDTLHNLHLAHLYSVPFENLDIHLSRPIVLNLDRLFAKIVRRNRGGFCYELNGLFAWLLGELGFNVTLLSAIAAHDNGGFGPEFDHLVLRVECPADPVTPSVPWLVDVGWGDTFRYPLRLDRPDVDQLEGARGFRIDRVGDSRLLWQQDQGGLWEKQYRFSLRPRQLTDFEPMCLYHQTSPESHFTQQRICTLATPDGRITLSEQKLILTKNGRRQERQLAPDEYWDVLSKRFGIDLK